MVCTHRTPHKHDVGYIYKYLIGDKQLMGLFQFPRLELCIIIAYETRIICRWTCVIINCALLVIRDIILYACTIIIITIYFARYVITK